MMTKVTLPLTFLITCTVQAGELGTILPSITDPTSTASLSLNNNDYVGPFADNPNRFKVNRANASSQSIVNTERLIPTRPSGGVTEYAVSIGGSYNDSDARPGARPAHTNSWLQKGLASGILRSSRSSGGAWRR